VSDTIHIGARVRLRPSHNWLSRYAPLAERGRLGTVTALEGDRNAHVEFDVVRRGAKTIKACFMILDLIVCDAPKVEQMEASL
jgi:hypothetical protein